MVIKNYKRKEVYKLIYTSLLYSNLFSAVINGSIIDEDKDINGYVRFANGLVFQWMYINTGVIPDINKWYNFTIPIDRLKGEYSHIILTYNHLESPSDTKTESFSLYWDFTAIYRIKRMQYIPTDPAGRLHIFIRMFI